MASRRTSAGPRAARALLLAAAALALSCAPPAPSFPVTVVADPGPFASLEAAAAAADSVDWGDADRSDDDACTEAFAATELRRFLPRALGVAPELVRIAAAGAALPERGDVIVVGPAAARRFGRSRPLPDSVSASRRDAFRLASGPQRGRTVVVIEGASRSGTLAGAYALLEGLGVRFHLPGDSCVAYPEPTRLPPHLDRIESPAFDLRGFWAWEARGDEDFFLWMARNRFNLWTAAEPRKGRLRQLGIRLADGGHILQEELLAPRLNFARHPEWFGFENGARRPGIAGESGLNFCTSNPEARAAFARGLAASLAAGRLARADVVQLWPLDGGRWCACDRCAAQGNPADRWLAVGADAAGAIAEARRGGRIGRRVTLMLPAYLETATPPARPAPPAPADADLSVAYFPYFRCYAHALGDPRCYEMNRAMAARLLGWVSGDDRPYRGPMAIGEYYNVSWVKSLPLVLPRVMGDDLFDLARLGVRDFFYMHAPTRRFGPWALNHAVLAGLLWNPRADADALVADFVAREYPGVATEMRTFYAALERGTSNLLALQHAVGSVGTGDYPRLLDPAIPIFPLRHLRGEARGSGADSAASLPEIEAAMAEARAALDAARARARGRRLDASLADVEARFAYGEAMLGFWIALLRAAAADREGRTDRLRAEVARADSLAARLREVRDLVAVSASHANARDGLEASGATRAYEGLRARALRR